MTPALTPQMTRMPPLMGWLGAGRCWAVVGTLHGHLESAPDLNKADPAPGVRNT